MIKALGRSYVCIVLAVCTFIGLSLQKATAQDDQSRQLVVTQNVIDVFQTAL